MLFFTAADAASYPSSWDWRTLPVLAAKAGALQPGADPQGDRMETRERLEIRLWVQKAIALYESSGKDELLRQIADPQGQFIREKRYIFALDIDGKLLAHPFSKPLVGMNLLDLKDCDGKTFVRRMIATSRNRGYGFADYKWRSLDSKEEYQKTVFFERVDQIVLCGGIYANSTPFETI